MRRKSDRKERLPDVNNNLQQNKIIGELHKHHPLFSAYNYSNIGITTQPGGIFSPGWNICFEKAPAFYSPTAEQVKEAVAQSGGKGAEP